MSELTPDERLRILAVIHAALNDTVEMFADLLAVDHIDPPAIDDATTEAMLADIERLR